MTIEVIEAETVGLDFWTAKEKKFYRALCACQNKLIWEINAFWLQIQVSSWSDLGSEQEVPGWTTGI